MIAMMTLLLASLSFAADAPAAKPADIDGKALFGAKCAMCHAKDAKGNPNMAKTFKVDQSRMNLVDATSQFSDADLTKVVLEGRGTNMKPWKDKLKDSEIAAILAYVHTLAPAKTDATKGAAPAGDKK